MRSLGWGLPGPAVLFCAACVAFQSPSEQARKLAETAGFVSVEMSDKRLLAYGKRVVPGANNTRVTVYVESDGAPWRFPDAPPADPTPLTPLVLGLALADRSSAAAYLGRPCQYLSEAARLECDPELWMRGRFSYDAVAAMNLAVDQIKRIYGAAQVNLVGYSGGGAMAALMAQRRSDIRCLVTLAAPLDTGAWAAALGVSPLELSLNPADEADLLRGVRQTHFTATLDRIVPPATSRRFFDRVTGATVIEKKNFDHQCCWRDEWTELRRASCLAE